MKQAVLRVWHVPANWIIQSPIYSQIMYEVVQFCAKDDLCRILILNCILAAGSSTLAYLQTTFRGVAETKSRAEV